MTSDPRAMPGPFSGLSVKIITTIVIVILAVEVVIYLPSAANFRTSWLDDRLRVGVVAARVLDAVPDAMNLPRMLTDRLLTSAGALAIVYRRDDQSQLIELENAETPREAVTVDMRTPRPATQILGALDTLVLGRRPDAEDRRRGNRQQERIIELLMPEAPLRAELLAYSRNLFFLSLILAIITSAVLYLFVSRILSPDPAAHRQHGELSPGARERRADRPPTPRRDEIGIMEQELAAMEADIFSMLRQRRHLADLGLAVAKINHDLRNTLTSAQLLSDQVANLDDPKVQRLAPRLVQSIDKAIGFAQSVLDYGRQSVTPPRPVPVDLHLLLDEAAFDAGAGRPPGIRFVNGVPDAVRISADPDQFARIFVNLLKNAREALEANQQSIPTLEIAFAESRRG